MANGRLGAYSALFQRPSGTSAGSAIGAIIGEGSGQQTSNPLGDLGSLGSLLGGSSNTGSAFGALPDLFGGDGIAQDFSITA